MSTQELLVRTFSETKEQTIRPTLSEIGERIKLQGHEYQLEDGPIQTILASPPYGSITLKVFPKDVNWQEISRFDLFNKIPFISFGLNLGERKLEVFVYPICEGNRFGRRQFGSGNRYDLADVKRETILQEVETFLESIPLEL